MTTEIQTNSTTLQTTGGIDCIVHTWNVLDAEKIDTTENITPKAIVIIYHGFGAHSKFPTVRYGAELLASNGYAVFAMDIPGHGASPGLSGYIRNVDDLVEYGVDIAVYVHKYALSIGEAIKKRQKKENDGNNDNNNDDDEEKKEDPTPKLFLMGSSMGGAIALAVSMEITKQHQTKSSFSKIPSTLQSIDGVLLLAPMLAISISEPIRYLLRTLSFFLPQTPLISSSASSSEDQCRDPTKRKECDDDLLSYKGKMRCASACTCVEFAKGMQGSVGDVTCPFLCMVSMEDKVVDKAGSEDLFRKAKSVDKVIKRYDALHALLCEPEPLYGEIVGDLLGWLEERV